jgi:predicted nucleic acid-binding protein
MKNLFLDTNVVIDYLANRQPFAADAGKLFQLALDGKVKIYISALSYNNIHYVLRQTLSNTATIKVLEEIAEMSEIADVSKLIIRKALKSEFKDFEDAIQYYCALNLNKIDCIVTRNSKDFKKSNLALMTPSEAIAHY